MMDPATIFSESSQSTSGTPQTAQTDQTITSESSAEPSVSTEATAQTITFEGTTGASVSTETPEQCHWESWNSWSKCDCRLGVKSRSRNAKATSRKNCKTDGCSREIKPCTHGFPCPIDCIYSKWSHWSHCDGHCDHGTRWRRRYVRIPALYGGKRCKRTFFEKEHCYADDAGCARDCEVGQWGSWTECRSVSPIESCECSDDRKHSVSGYHYRERLVIRRGEDHCPELQETKSCELSCC